MVKILKLFLLFGLAILGIAQAQVGLSLGVADGRYSSLQDFQRSLLAGSHPVFNPSPLPTVSLSTTALSGSQNIPSVANSGSVVAGATLNTFQCVGGASTTNGAYTGDRVNTMSGSGFGQTGFISSYVGGSQIATVPTWTASPGYTPQTMDTTSSYAILNTNHFAFLGANPQFLYPTGVGNTILENYVGNSDCNSFEPFTISFDYTGYGFDLPQFGNQFDGNNPYLFVWIDGNYVGGYESALLTGVAQGGSSTTITLQAGTAAITGAYNQFWITITSGTGSGQTRQVQSYSTGLVATMASAWTTAPDSTSHYTVNYTSTGLSLPISTNSFLTFLFTDGTGRPISAKRNIRILTNQFEGVDVGTYDSVTPGPAYGPIPELTFGDSWWWGIQNPANNPGMCELLAEMMGCQSWNLSSSGTGILNNNSGSDRASFVDRIAPPAESWKIQQGGTGGTYTLSFTYNGSTQTTGAIAFNASGPTLAAAINALSNAPANSPLCLSGFATCSGYDRPFRPLCLCLHGCPGASISINQSGVTGGTMHVEPYQGDLAQNLPRDAKGNLVRFVLWMPGSTNDISVSSPSAVQAAATYIALQIPIRFPQAIPFFGGIISSITQGGAGVLTSTDMAWDAALQAAAANLPPLANGQSPYITMYGQGLGGKNPVVGGGSVASPTAGLNDILVGYLVTNHPTDIGGQFWASNIFKQMQIVLGTSLMDWDLQNRQYAEAATNNYAFAF